MAVGTSATAFLVGGLATKANAMTTESLVAPDTPALLAGSYLEQPLTRFLSSSAEKDPYAFAEAVLASRDKGPLEKNVIDNGGILLTSGTVIYKAPVEGAIDHVIPKGRFALWAFVRLVPVGGTLWAVAWNNEKGAYSNQVRESRGNEWVKVPKDNTATFKHLVPRDYNPDKSRNYPRTIAVQIIPGNASRLQIVGAPGAPEDLMDWRNIATRYEDDIKYLRKDNIQFAPGGEMLIPAEQPLRFEKAKVSSR